MVTLLVSLATQSILAWMLGTSGRGSYAVCLVFTSFLTILFVVGFDVAIEYFIASRKFSVSQGVTCTFICGALSSIVAMGAGLLAMLLPVSFLQNFFAKATPFQFYLALATLPMSLAGNILIRMPVALSRFKQGAIINIGLYVFQFILIVLFVVVLGMGVEGALLSLFINSACGILLMLILLRKWDTFRFERLSLAQLREVWSFGMRYYVGKISNLANAEIGTVLLAMFATREDVGMFSQASAITVRAYVLPEAITTVLIPRVAGNKLGRPELVAQCARVVSILCTIVLGLLAIFAEPIVRILFSEEFLPSVPLIRIIAIGVVVRCVCKVFVPYIICTDRPGIASISVAVGMITNLLMLWLLLPTLGMIGAAMAMMGNNIVSSGFLFLAFAFFSKMRYRDIWRFSRQDWPDIRNIYHQFRGRVLGPTKEKKQE